MIQSNDVKKAVIAIAFYEIYNLMYEFFGVSLRYYFLSSTEVLTNLLLVFSCIISFVITYFVWRRSFSLQETHKYRLKSILVVVILITLFFINWKVKGGIGSLIYNLTPVEANKYVSSYASQSLIIKCVNAALLIVALFFGKNKLSQLCSVGFR